MMADEVVDESQVSKTALLSNCRQGWCGLLLTPELQALLAIMQQWGPTVLTDILSS